MKNAQPAVPIREVARKYPLAIFTVSEMKSELTMIRRAMKLPATTEPLDDCDDDEWNDIISDFMAYLGPLPESDICTQWALSATDRSRQIVAVQICRALRAIKHASGLVDDTSTATGLLLPISFSERIELLLGRALLPLAWVRQLDILRF
ncbi:hypothetical protein [Sulfuriflexus mobilis]|uniref:hypothetical protein n=1 Tax=Sulfuriflexus mobilis TaxID=1811807 RepID=UPI000F84912E|nr:hypothetical protein [Sulfuriflexus mobilis]